MEANSFHLSSRLLGKPIPNVNQVPNFQVENSDTQCRDETKSDDISEVRI